MDFYIPYMWYQTIDCNIKPSKTSRNVLKPGNVNIFRGHKWVCQASSVCRLIFTEPHEVTVLLPQYNYWIKNFFFSVPITKCLAIETNRGWKSVFWKILLTTLSNYDTISIRASFRTNKSSRFTDVHVLTSKADLEFLLLWTLFSILHITQQT